MSTNTVSQTPSPPTPPDLFPDEQEKDESYNPLPLPESMARELVTTDSALSRDNQNLVDEPMLNTAHNNEKLHHTNTVTQYLGTFVPTNTSRTNKNSLHAFFSYIYDTYNDKSNNTKTYGTLNIKKRKVLRHDNVKKFSEQLLFTDESGNLFPSKYDKWPLEVLQKLNHYLIEFAVNYKSSITSEKILPSSMKTYILDIQRALKEEYGYNINLLKDPVFLDKQNGLMPLLNNRFRDQQFRGLHSVSHNVLTSDDLRKLFQSPLLTRSTAIGFQARLVFNVALNTAMRPTALHELLLSDFSRGTVKNEPVIIITEKSGSLTGGSKTNKGGWKAASLKPSQVCVWNRSYLEGHMNIYQDLDKYLSWRMSDDHTITTEKFFLACNCNALEFKRFFKNQNLGRHRLTGIVKDVCGTCGIKGSGVKDEMTLHGLRGTVASILLEKGHSDSSVAMRTGHRDMRSLKSYQTLRGPNGVRQEEDLFGNHSMEDSNLGDSKKKAKIEVEEEKPQCIQVCPNITNVSGGSIHITVNLNAGDDEKKETSGK